MAHSFSHSSPSQHWLWRGKILLRLMVVAFAVFVICFQHFVHETRLTYTQPPSPLASQTLDNQTTGIVVATGGDGRIAEGFALLTQGVASRMLISGVGAGISKADIEEAQDGILTEAQLTNLMACCVDLGTIAINTKGNAEESEAWAIQHGFDHIILVTADYHMPRSRLLFAQYIHRDIIPHAVPSAELIRPADGMTIWWKHPLTIWRLTREYAKYLHSKYSPARIF